MVSLAVVVGPPARAGFQGVSVVMMAWSWRSRLQAMVTCFSSNVAFSVFDQSTPCGFGRWL